jgi:hypothetical protein
MQKPQPLQRSMMTWTMPWGEVHRSASSGLRQYLVIGKEREL